MSADSKIAWTDHTFNCWHGCTKASPGCANCYAAAMSNRFGHDIWGDDKPRRFFGDKHWSEPLKWNRKAAREGHRMRVFCGSMCDVFEARPDLDEWRIRLWGLIANTPYLTWMILTKRPENFVNMIPWFDGGIPWPNVWLGVTAEDQKRADERIPILLDTPAVMHFVSCEPLLEQLDLRRYFGPQALVGNMPGRMSIRRGLNWTIAGSESGPRRRPADTNWFRNLCDQCCAANVPYFFKQQVYDGKLIETPELDVRRRIEQVFDGKIVETSELFWRRWVEYPNSR